MVVIFVVLTMLFFVGIDVVLHMRKRKQQTVAGPAGRIHPTTPVKSMADGLTVPSGLFVHPGHTWAQILPSGTVRVGSDDFVRRAMDRIDRVDLRNPGDRVSRGDPLLVLERDGRRLVLPAPVSGVVRKANTSLVENPKLLEAGPYGEGWACLLNPLRLADELGELKVAQRAKSWLEAEVRRFGEWIKDTRSVEPAATMLDGGVPVAGALAHLDEAGWNDFQQKFLGGNSKTWPRPS